MFVPITKESAMKMFNTQEEIWNDMTGPGYVDYGESLKEDYQHNDDEWGDPYTFDEVERELNKITNGWTDKEGTIRCYWEQEKNYGKQILKDHYKYVEVSDGRTGRGEDMSWVIAYSTPKEIEEDFTFEDNIKQANDLRKQNQALFDKTLVGIKTPENKKGNKFKFFHRGDK